MLGYVRLGLKILALCTVCVSRMCVIPIVVKIGKG